MLLIDTTKSLCPECLKVIDARVIEKDENAYIAKHCDEHGDFEALHPLGKSSHYKAMKSIFKRHLPKACPDGLVVNITSRCDLNCPFCFARANEYEMREPSIEEIKEKISGFSGSIIYLSGGEPTLRKDLFDIIRTIKNLGYKAILFTNGKRLADGDFARGLKKNKLDLVILQFDTFDEEQCEALRGERLVATKLKAIENLKQANIPVYLFVMLSKGLNTDQIDKLIDFTARNSRFIKLLNFNPVWEMGRVGRHEPMNMADIFTEVEKNSLLGVEDFIEGTVFGYYVFEIYRKLKNKGGNKHPWCEMRSYVASGKNGLVTLSRLIDIKKANIYLKKIDDILGNSKRLRKVRFFIFLPYHFFIKEFFLRKNFRAFIFQLIISSLDSIFKASPAYFTHSKMFSVIVGTFHTAFNIDLGLVETCNLYSDFPEGQHRSSCLRQIAITRDIEKAKGVFK